MNTITLAGLWLFTLGSPSPDPAPPSTPPDAFGDMIELPGTTETRGKGPLSDWADPGGLTRIRRFDGPAWYRREIEVPPEWAGKRVELSLERTKWTRVWLDSETIGHGATYGTPQTFDLTGRATPGHHTLTVLVDNRTARIPVNAHAHQFDDSVQTNWNGILGDISLRATDPVWLDNIQVDPDVAARAFRVRIRLGNTTGKPASGSFSISASSFNHAGQPQLISIPACSLTGDEADIFLPLGPEAKLWDEFAPALYNVTVKLDAGSYHDERSIETGLREFRTKDRQFTINGRPTFLRGKHDAGAFPLTGHPPMDLDGWITYLGKVREWGFNHIRCHTWIPPKAAFQAADRLGMYLQPELPFWGTFDANARDYLMPEAEALLREYGNHPSFVMLTLANEAGGDRDLMNAMVTELRARDPRHLYADGCNNCLWDPVFQPTNDFMISAKVRPPAHPEKMLPARGSFCVFDGDDGHTQWGPSETRYDLTAALEGLPVPLVGHETGQWTVYPNYRETPKYTGILRPRNLERFRGILEKNGMLDQADAFQRASGALAAELYREENELFRRSPGIGGYQHLDLQDYPGQGTALVGLLDAFMDSKGVVTAAEYRRSSDPLVLLARFDRYVWTNAETYVADLQLSHYGPADLRSATASWSLVDSFGRAVAGGSFAPADYAQGGLRDLGRVSASLAKVTVPTRLDLVVKLDDVAEQRWPVWVYPTSVDTAVPANVALVRTFDAAAKALLAAGQRVVLVPDNANWANTVPGGYATDFWNWPMFHGTPGTMGLLIDPSNPALANFPTTFHSERQWADLAHASTPVILTNTPAVFRPIVQVIDNYERNEKLGLVFEAAVGSGKLLVCAVDLLGAKLRERPEAKQLLAGLLAYASGESFVPKQSLDTGVVDTFLRPSLAYGQPVSASSSFTPPWGFVPKPLHSVDGNINTAWRPAADDPAPWFAIDLGRLRTIDSIELLWGTDEPGYRYRVESSTDGTTWAPLLDESENTFDGGRHLLPVKATAVQHLRIMMTATPAGHGFELRELRLLGE